MPFMLQDPAFGHFYSFQTELMQNKPGDQKWISSCKALTSLLRIYSHMDGFSLGGTHNGDAAAHGDINI